MKKPKSPKKKLPKYEGGGNFGKNVKNTGLFLADTILAEWAPNAIKQDQYADTKWGSSLGNVASVHESFDSQSPISKNVSKLWNDGKTGMTEDQMKLYGQAQPIAKVGSKIGEMWTGSAMGGVGGKGATGQMIQTGTKQGLSAQYDPTQNMYQDPNTQRYPDGGITQPNAEVEKQENAITPNGQFVQYNGPSHEQGGIPTRLPGGTDVFSDRLKMPGTSKTFAKLNKPNNTTKEDKILEDTKSNSVAKATASLMKLAKQANSDKLFQSQETLKQSKIDKYTMKLGGTMKYPDGGKVDSNGFPIDSTGRRLTPEEQQGFNRPGNSYGNSIVSGNSTIMSGINQNTGRPAISLANAGTNTNPIINYPEVGFGYQAGNNSTFTQPNTMTDAEFIANQQARLGLPKQVNGGKFKLKGEDDPEIIVPGSTSNTYLGNPTQDLSSTEDRYSNTRNLSPFQASILNKSAMSYKPEQTPEEQTKYSPWADIAKQSALAIGNNLGNIYDLNRSKNVEVDKYDRITPRLLDPTASLRDTDTQSRIAATNIKNASIGNAGTYLSNRGALAAQTSLAKDKIRRDTSNMNASIENSAKQYNAETHKAEDIANMQNRAASRNIKANAISKIGVNSVGQYKDTQMTQADLNKIELIKTMYPAIKNNKEMMSYYKTKYPNFNWSEIEK